MKLIFYGFEKDTCNLLNYLNTFLLIDLTIDYFLIIA